MKKLLLWINKVDAEDYLSDLTLSFFLLIWILNPFNKLLLGLFCAFLIVLNIKIKNFTLSSFFTYFLTSFFYLGKTYEIVLNDLKAYPYLKLFYPTGLTSTFVLSISDVIFAIFFLSLIINLIKNKDPSRFLKGFTLLDGLIVIFFATGIATDIIVSKRLYLSLLLKKGVFEIIIIYFYLRFFFKNYKYFFKLFLTLLALIVLFESFVALQQFIISAPLGKNFELEKGLEVFGVGADELSFTFRPLGTFSHANYLAIFIAITSPLLFLTLFKKTRKLIVLSFILGTLVLLLTLSRTAWLGVLSSILFLLYIMEYRYKIDLFNKLIKKKIILFLLLLLPFIVYISPRIAKSIYSYDSGGGLNLRIRQIGESMDLLKSHLFTGVGTGLSVVESIENNKKGVFTEFPSPVHNFYFLTLIENGIVTVLLLLLIIMFAVKKIFSYHTLLSYAIIGSLMVIFIEGIFQPAFDYQLFFVLIAINFGKINNYEVA